MTVTNR